MKSKKKQPYKTCAIEMDSIIIHPGQYVRDQALKPIKMTVTQAAELIGISRPNVSNFLNGKVSATPEMAARIERAFNISAQTLLDMQAAYDALHAKEKGTPANTKAYVPPFLAIKASAIEAWAGSIVSRIRLSVFLRTLVHSTGHGLTKVDFPGNDDAERPGWDGLVEASEGTPWIPAGLSGWEFGTNSDVKRKADKDFAKSIKALSKDERAKITFIFVTPRRWAGKKAWETEQNAKQQWKEVRVYDANNLEQWLEQSLAGQVWFANETHMHTQHVRSLDACWTEWSEISVPPLTGTLFKTAVDAAKDKMQAWLKGVPEKPFIIAADSTGEALAFLSQLFNETEGEELKAVRDRVIVFDSPGVLARLAQSVKTFIPVASTREVEREFATYTQKMHCIITCPRNAANADPNIVLEPLPYEAFRKALEEMSKGKDEISRFEKASGRSLTVFRRQLSNVPALKTPEWAENHEIAVSLVPFLFIGAWNSENETDREAMSLIADKSYEQLEKSCQQLDKLNDPPMWSVGGFRGVVSKIDLLFAIAGVITKEDLKQYFSLARMVLGEDDPTLDLSEAERWAATIHGKVRKFSDAFRKGVSETLVLLAVYGNALFKTRINIDTEIEAAKIIQELLPPPLTTRSLEVNNYDLPTYAEAAPDKFLSIVEADLDTKNPATLNLLRPADSGVFGRSPSRTGLLWALESLAWNPRTLPRVAFILARLSQIEINDNWVNKPIHSLESIFRSWMPQTAASHEERVSVIKRLIERFPSVAWELCIKQISIGHDTGDYSHKPQWRTDGYGHGEPFKTMEPIWKFQREIAEMVLGWETYNVNMLGDLLSRLDGLSEEHEVRVWGLIKVWAVTACDNDKAILREKLRTTCLSNRAARKAKKKGEQVALSQIAKDVYQMLEPSDLINKHIWLFRNAWIEESYDEIHGEEEFDYQKREERIAKLRIDALREIFEQQGQDGILATAEQGKAARQIGWHLAHSMLDISSIIALLRKALSSVLAKENNLSSKKQLVNGALAALTVKKQEEVLIEISKETKDIEMAEVLLLAPFGSSTWRLVDKLNDEAQDKYWADVAPDLFLHSDDERAEIVDRLLKAQRPRAAFSCICHQLDKISVRVLFRIFSDILAGGKDQAGHYQLEEHYVREVFQHISNSSELTFEEKAGLEFAYIDALAKPFGNDEGNAIPNLEKYVQLHPEFFVQTVVWSYKRNDDGIDPPEFQIESEHIEQRARKGYKFLHGLKRIPGYKSGELDTSTLAEWIKAVREACVELGRSDVCDIRIGELLSHAPVGSDGVWPCEAVRDVMEDLHPEHIMRGVHTGRYNSRGVHARGDGGAQERELANKYRKWAQALQFTHPYVASELLMNIAKGYEHEADREDSAAGVRRRMQ